MAKHKIKFIIEEDGTVTHEVVGYVGPDCMKETAWIDDVLKGTGKKVTYKPEYYKPRQEIKIANK